MSSNADTPNHESDNRLPTGEWNGFYLESHRSGRGWMSMYLQFTDGKINGEGTDYVGPWVSTGHYDVDTGKSAINHPARFTSGHWATETPTSTTFAKTSMCLTWKTRSKIRFRWNRL